MKTFRRRVGIFLAFLGAALIHFACQLPTEPTNVTTNSPTTVIVEDQGNNPIKDATLSIEWRTLRATDSVWHSMPLANAPVHDGTFADIIPIPVGDDTTLVVFQVNAPLGYAPQTHLDTEIGYCGSRTFTFHLTQIPITVTICDPTAKSATLTLIANEPSKPRDTASTPSYINSLGALSFTYSTVPTFPSTASLPNIVLEYSVDGTFGSAFPKTVLAGSKYQFRYRFNTDGLTSQSSSTQYVVTIIGNDAAGDVCVNIVDTVNTQIIVQTPCDCPSGTFRYYDTASTCVGNMASDTVSPKLSNANTQCSVILTRLASSKLDNDVVISPDLNGTVIPPGSNIPTKIALTFTPQAVKTYDVEYDYGISLRSQSGTVTPCDSVLRIYFHGTVGMPECQFDLSQNSSILRDTMMQVIDGDSSSGLKQFCIKNPGSCPVVISIANIGGAEPHPFRIVTPEPLMIAPNSSACVEVSFNPTDTDVWPHGRVGNNPIDIFNATLHVTTSTEDGSSLCDTTVNIVGELSLPHYNNPCLQAWGTNNFYGGLVLDDSGTFTQPTIASSPNSFSIYASVVGAATATLTSGGSSGGPGSYVVFSKIDNNLNFASGDICSLSASKGYSDKCETIAGMTSSIGNLMTGDVVLFEYIDPKTGRQECGLLWITGFDNTSGNGISVCFQMCFPIS